jgi:glycogen(starch) synthase
MGRPWPFHHYDADADALLKGIQLLGEGLKLSGRAGSFDAVCFQGWETCLLGLALREQLRAPSVCLMQRTTIGASAPPLGDEARYRAEMEAWAFQQADLVICPSHTVAAELVGRCGASREKVTVVPPASDPALIDPGDTNLDDFRALFARSEDLAVLFAGRLTADNEPGALLHALPQVVGEAPMARAIFAGDGPLASELMEGAERLGVAEHCLFIGGVGQCVLSALYRTCDVLVSPGSYAPSGIGAVEAMSAGLPVVASETGALVDLVHDGRSGLLIPPGDPDGLAGALHWLDAHRGRLRAMGKRALAASQGWTWDMAGARFVEAVESISRPTVPDAMARVN